MPLDKAIDRTCRNHGTCEWCQGSRQYKNDKRIDKMNERLKEYDEQSGSRFYKQKISK